jgi:hypothetical protein
MRQVVLFLGFIFCFALGSQAQKHHIMLGTDVPLQYALGYEYKPVKWLGLQAKAGILTSPYDQVILNTLSLFGVEKGVVNIINGAFDFGEVAQVGINFHIQKWYCSIYTQYFLLKASNIPENLIESYYGYDFTPINLSGGLLNLRRNEIEITMQSKLLQAGLGFGRKINLCEWAELRLELMAGKNIWNNTNIDVSSVKGTVYGLLYNEEDLKKELEAELKNTYKTYAYTPSLNVYWIVKF